MSEPEKFLSRWSKRKLESDRNAAAPQDQAAGETDDKTANEAAKPGDENETIAGAQKPPQPFDPSSLPSLESIGAQSDIRAFLQPGVPPELARAALRRAWAADPAIRGFIGLAENSWDFTVPNAAMGFGPLGAGTDVARLLAEVFGDSREREAMPPATQTEQAAPVSNESGVANTGVEDGDAGENTRGSNAGTIQDINPANVSQADVSQHAENIASQQKDFSAADSDRDRVKRHGSAIPKI